MAYFHSRLTKCIGGMKRRHVIKVLGETLEELKSLNRKYPDNTVIIWPRRGINDYRGRSKLELWVDVDRKDILQEIEAGEVGEWTLSFLSMELRFQFWKLHGHGEIEAPKWFEGNIRGKAIQVRQWEEIYESENLGLKNLFERIEKCDLGRRNDLNPHHPEYRKSKYITQPKTEDNSHVVDWEAKYRNSSPEERERLLEEHPFLKRIVNL